ncbi:hypothetical protein HKD37_15G044036 [Glycine soja]
MFFSFSLLNYNGRRHVFIYAKKVEEHIKVAIFISKNPRVHVCKHKSLIFFGCFAFILFSGFSQYKSLHFLCVPEPSPMCSLLPMPCFLCFRPFLVRKHKSLIFFGCSAFILFSDFLQYKSLNFFVLLNLLHFAHCFLCPAFCVFVLFWWCNGSIYFLACCMQRRWKNTLKLQFLSQKLHEYRFIMTVLKVLKNKCVIFPPFFS